MTTQDQETTIKRTILASPARVYAAFSSAEGWCAWCCETAEVDARVGGNLHIYTEGYHAHGAFTELEQDKKLVFTWDGDGEPPVLIQVVLDGQDGTTHLTFRVKGVCSKEEWAGIVSFLERIWGRVLNNLKVVLEET